jgi:peptidyl-prolyl cis-trans isomerase B (cyclophilin B)
MRRNVIIALLVVEAVSACSTGTKKVEVKTPETTGASVVAGRPGKTATIATNMGDIVVALDPKAPKAAGRFSDLIRAGFYNGLTFHRVVPDFVIQGGDPKGDGTGGSGKPPVVGEVPTDNYPVGSLAAAKSAADPPGTFDCQFFIVTGSNGASLPNEYARFGMVTSGLDVAKKIESLAPPEGDGPPTKRVVIEKITLS